MTNLVEFLRARLDEDEQAARATTGPWKYHRETGGVVLPTARHVPELGEIVSTPREPSDARHMVRWDSARVLREVEADRKLIAAYTDIQRRKHENTQKLVRMMRNPAAHAEDLPAVKSHGWELSGREEGLRYALMMRAERFDDHPDYQQEWKP